MNDGWKNANVTAYGFQKDSEQYAWAFKIADGEDAGETITMYASTGASQKAYDFTLKQCHKLGGQGDDLSEMVLDTETIVSILVETSDYKGKPRQQVKAVGSSGGGGGVKPADPASAKALAASLKAKFGGAAAGSTDDTPF